MSEKTLSPETDARSDSSEPPSPEMELPDAVRKLLGSQPPVNLEAMMSALWYHVQDKQKNLGDALVAEIERQSTTLKEEIKALSSDTCSRVDSLRSQITSDLRMATASSADDLSALRQDLEAEINRINNRQNLEEEIGQMRKELNTMLKEFMLSSSSVGNSAGSSHEIIQLGLTALREELEVAVQRETMERKASIEDLETRINQSWESLGSAVGEHARQHIGVLSTALAAETALRASDKETYERRFCDLRNQFRQLVSGEEDRVAMNLKSIGAVREKMDSLREELSELYLKNEDTSSKYESLYDEVGPNGTAMLALGQRMDDMSEKMEALQEQQAALGSRMSALASRVMSMGGKTQTGERPGAKSPRGKAQRISEHASPAIGARGFRASSASNKDDAQSSSSSRHLSPTHGTRGNRGSNKDDAQIGSGSSRQLSPIVRQMQHELREKDERERHSKAAVDELRRELALIQQKIQSDSFCWSQGQQIATTPQSTQSKEGERLLVPSALSSFETTRNSSQLSLGAQSKDGKHPAVLALNRVDSQKFAIMRMASAPSNLVPTKGSPVRHSRISEDKSQSPERSRGPSRVLGIPPRSRGASSSPSPGYVSRNGFNGA